MAGMNDSKGLADLMFSGPDEGGDDKGPADESEDTEGAYTEACQDALDAFNASNLDGLKSAMRDVVHFASLLGPSEMATEEPAESEA